MIAASQVGTVAVTDTPTNLSRRAAHFVSSVSTIDRPDGTTTPSANIPPARAEPMLPPPTMARVGELMRPSRST